MAVNTLFDRGGNVQLPLLLFTLQSSETGTLNPSGQRDLRYERSLPTANITEFLALLND